ncbi:MAG: hypothetical protein ACFE96_03070 [Candidatus Hermodarchaeota archaeon]
MTRYNLNNFLTNLFKWVNSFRVNNQSGFFSVKQNQKSPTLYGLTDMVYNLLIPNQLDDYLAKYTELSKDEWIEKIKSFQNSKTGWFKEPRFNFGFHFKEHSSAFATSALKLLGAEPSFEFNIREKLNTQAKVNNWLKRSPEWGLLFWPGSHRGGGVASIFATLNRAPHNNFFIWYFDWLDKKADPKVGYWRIGWIYKLKKRLTIHELGGSIHYYWIYEFLNRPIPYPEKVIDSTLALQNDKGLWDGDVSYCIDLDAIFALLRCQRLVPSYRNQDITEAILKYLDYTIPSLNDRDFLFNRYDNSHKLTGCLGAIAEVYKYHPELFDLPKPWIQTLDITPWI